ncbi:hypothetical protein QJS04_geneDACA000829 [Acorus gramineus]|uniref:Uncharacterized protein n=1 Tax=Acorus gramineus TaxID=55184 RepID=A0AAV9BHS1_ACOGR|nr:hypothetical protein QJS04_geneDACA000829 [Acorus gramineus]
MDYELRSARQKLEREQRERKERARLMIERERKAMAEALRQREAIEYARAVKRIEASDAQILVLWKSLMNADLDTVGLATSDCELVHRDKFVTLVLVTIKFPAANVQKADKQLEESLLLGDGIIFCQILEAIPFDGLGDKIKLPPSCFSELSEKRALDKGPMYFLLSKLHQVSVAGANVMEYETDDMTHSGVLEFTAPEGYVELPPHVWGNLFPASGSLSNTLIEVRYVRLPKGTYAKLQASEMGFLDIPNHRAVLETGLRQHATLSQGDIITVNFGDLSYRLHVLELRPSTSVSVLETDIDVDIVTAVSAVDQTNKHVLIPLIFGKAESGVVNEGNYVYYKFSVDDDTCKEISLGKENLEVKLEAEMNEGDTDLYVSRHPIIFPTKHQHEWSSHDLGSKILILGDKNHGLSAGTYSIGVYGFKKLTKYQILVTMKESSSGQRVGEVSVPSSEDNVDSVECSNCKRNISRKAVMLHEAYCARHNVVCKYEGCGVVLRKEEAGDHVHCNKCQRALQSGEMEKHMKVFHEPLHCSCGVILEKEDMVKHQSSVCPKRLIACRFCGDMVYAGSSPMDVRDRLRGLSEHESVCGSRTAPCDSCGRSVMLKEMDIHMIAVHQKN